MAGVQALTGGEIVPWVTIRARVVEPEGLYRHDDRHRDDREQEQREDAEPQLAVQHALAVFAAGHGRGNRSGKGDRTRRARWRATAKAATNPDERAFHEDVRGARDGHD